MVFTPAVFQAYVKKSDRLYVKKWQITVFSVMVFPLEWTFFHFISLLIYLCITSFTVFIFYIFFIAAVMQNFIQLFTLKICFTNNYVSIVEQFHSGYTITYGT